eukprot:TRINITY_DN806_c0_g4_i1.p1 TRINITY_DN806_c0_g4~~TRINITY_DN806_c0_g4_i1.p1  ORF type:complete len:200 (+),score=30.22 TRINITY_DN806_c0_g4_i1:64-663(+)
MCIRDRQSTWGEYELKYKESESKRGQLIFEHEKEKARWNLEKDHLINAKNELQDMINKLERKKEALLRENEKLKNENRTQRRANISSVIVNQVHSSQQFTRSSRNHSPLSIKSRENKSDKQADQVSSPVTVTNIQASDNTLNKRNSVVNHSASFVSFTDKNNYDLPMQRKEQDYTYESKSTIVTSKSNNMFNSDKKEYS